MTGPLAFFTTFRSSESGGAGCDGGAATAVAGVESEQPVMTDIAPIRALRIMKARRSIPSGVVEGFGSRADREMISSRFSVVILVLSTRCRRSQERATEQGPCPPNRLAPRRKK